MTNYDLLNLIGEAREEYVFDAIKTKTGVLQKKKRLTLNRIGLIAAIIALLLLLVGCVAVYLRLQDMSIGKETYAESYNNQGLAIEPTEGIRDIVTWGGHSGDPTQLALKEWYEFLEIYDTNGALKEQFLESETIDFPEQYYDTYHCYTKEMADKLEEIAGKYDLKLLDSPLILQRYQEDLFWESTGLVSILIPESNVEIAHLSGEIYAPGNFNLDLDLKLKNEEIGLYGEYYYFSKDYLHNGGWSKIDLSKVSQWGYTTVSGTPVLLALSDKGSAYILAEQDKASILITIDGNLTASRYPQPEDIITKEQLEQIADTFDYTIAPLPIDLTILKTKLEETEAAYQAAHAYVPEQHGSFTEYLMQNKGLGSSQTTQYAFYDLTGDGVEELLLGSNGAYTTWLTMKNGKVISTSISDTHLCEDGIQEEVLQFSVFSNYEQHTYMAPISDSAVASPDIPCEVITCLTYKGDTWYQGPSRIAFDRTPISDEEAQAIMEKYTRIELNWYPISEYPIDDQGRTLGDYALENDDRLSAAELRKIYANLVKDIEHTEYTHFLIADINEDGRDDLCLSQNGETIYDIYSYSHGEVYGLASGEYYPCEENVLEYCDIVNMFGGVEKVEHLYFRFGARGLEPIAYIAYNKATASWERDREGTPITEAEAMAVMERYPRISVGFHPIEELIG